MGYRAQLPPFYRAKHTKRHVEQTGPVLTGGPVCSARRKAKNVLLFLNFSSKLSVVGGDRRLFCRRYVTKSSFCLTEQSQPFQLPQMLRAGGQQVDPSGLDGAVTQNIRQLHYVLTGPVKGPGEQVPQIVGKDLSRRHTGGAAQPLHLRPDLCAGQPFSASGEKDLAGGDFLFPGVLQQPTAQSVRKKNSPDLAL